MNEINYIYDGDLLKGLNFNFHCDYFFSSTKELFNCKKDDEDEVIDFLKKIKGKSPKMKICTNFEEDFNDKENIFFIKNLFELSDIYIFEKKQVIEFYDKIFSYEEPEHESDQKNIIKIAENNNLTEEKILEEFFLYKIQQKPVKDIPNMKLAIFLDNLQEIFLIEQNPKTELVTNNIRKQIKIMPQTMNDSDIQNYNEILKSKYPSIKSVYIGSFLNHLFKQEKQDSYNLCFKTASKCTTRYLEILKFGLDVPSVQKYYEIRFPRPIKKKINKEEIKNKQLESRFILDCTNLNRNKISTYNSILDENCRNFFNSRITLKHLFKQGFINKKGMLVDPQRKNEILGFVKNANGKNNKLIKKIRTLNVLNYKNASDCKDDRVKKSTMINHMNIQNLYKKDFDSFNETNNNRPYLTNHRLLLPKIKNRSNRSNNNGNNNFCLKKKNIE